MVWFRVAAISCLEILLRVTLEVIDTYALVIGHPAIVTVPRSGKNLDDQFA